MSATTSTDDSLPSAVTELAPSRAAVYEALSDHDEATAHDLTPEVEYALDTVRNALADLWDAGLASRRIRITRRPNNPYQYRIDADAEDDIEPETYRPLLRTRLPSELADVPESRTDVYQALRDAEETTAVELAADTEHSTSTVRRALDEMDALGLVERESVADPHSGDRWSVTERGSE